MECLSTHSQFECKLCKTISSGLICSNPRCPGYEENQLVKWKQKLIRNKYQDLDWGQLLNVLDSVTVEFITSAKVKPDMGIKEFYPGLGLIDSIVYPKGSNWLWLCSDKVGPNLNWVPATIQLRYNGFAVRVLKRDADARVCFPSQFFTREDLRYFEIGLIFKQMDRSADVATEMLERVKGNYGKSFGTDYDGFIDAMIVLLFGVEAARNWSTCATSLMLLELIAKGVTYGTQAKLFTLANAFHHDSKMWDEKTYYGGKHPMATHGTGSGNLIDRGKIVRSKGIGWEFEVSKDPKRHMVVYRELNVLRNWLQFTEAHCGSLTVEERIKQLLQTYFP